MFGECPVLDQGGSELASFHGVHKLGDRCTKFLLSSRVADHSASSHSPRRVCERPGTTPLRSQLNIRVLGLNPTLLSACSAQPQGSN